MMTFGLFLLVAFAIACGAYLVVSTQRGRPWALEYVRALAVMDPQARAARDLLAVNAAAGEASTPEAADFANAETVQRPALAA